MLFTLFIDKLILPYFLIYLPNLGTVKILIYWSTEPSTKSVVPTIDIRSAGCCKNKFDLCTEHNFPKEMKFLLSINVIIFLSFFPFNFNLFFDGAQRADKKRIKLMGLPRRCNRLGAPLVCFFPLHSISINFQLISLNCRQNKRRYLFFLQFHSINKKTNKFIFSFDWFHWWAVLLVFVCSLPRSAMAGHGP